MAKRKGKKKKVQDDEEYDPAAKRLNAEERAERRRATDRARYHRNPQIREKKRVQMAEKRAAVRARRRQWDPPKKTRGEVQLDTEEFHSFLEAHRGRTPSHSLTAPTTGNQIDASFSIENSGHKEDRGSGAPACATSAELLATIVLAEMARARVAAVGQQDDRISLLALATQPSPVSLPEDAEDSVLALAMQLSSTRSSAARCQASTESPRQETGDDTLQVLPPGVSPLTAKQSLRLQDSGTIGPLTPVQRAQVAVAELNSGDLLGPTPVEANLWADQIDLELPPELQTMGRERWLEIYDWNISVAANHDEEWDEEAQRAMLEAENSIRLLRIRDRCGIPVRPFFNSDGVKVIEY
ncbi:hypothetical protein FB451DRAFT_1410455 [Mycena latifolia]|nr:hypothetical protein FB451DRAFT_1410455 [Mycena latifolia]